ncbi:MAG: hypothetical protein HS111_18140 [Kofleriaceae bacterium]|nr:hypothetical protein [Kofleriaceae bacterium]
MTSVSTARAGRRRDLDLEHGASPWSRQLLGLGVDHDLDAHLLELARDHAHAVLVHRGQDRRRGLDHGDPGAELGVDHAQLEADVAAADHDHAPGHVIEGEGAGRVQDALLVGGEARDLERPRAGGEDDVAGDERLLAPRRPARSRGARSPSRRRGKAVPSTMSTPLPLSRLRTPVVSLVIHAALPRLQQPPMSIVRRATC